MAITLIQSGGAQSSTQNGVTTVGVDTSGATLLVVAVHYYAGGTPPTLTDNKGNSGSYVALSANGGSVASVRLYYMAAPAVGSGHTFTATGASSFPAASFLALAGSAASPFDQQNTYFDEVGGTALSVDHNGGITPSEANEIVIAAVTPGDSTSGLGLNGGFTTAYTVARAANAYGAGLAYLIQTAAAAANPTWSWTGGSAAASAIASFKSAAASGPPVITQLNDLVRPFNMAVGRR